MNSSESITEAPKDCDNSGSIWETGRKLFKYIREQVLEKGATGRVAFDDNGDRIFAEYNITNIKERGKNETVGQYIYSAVSNIDEIFIKLGENLSCWKRSIDLDINIKVVSENNVLLLRISKFIPSIKIP